MSETNLIDETFLTVKAVARRLNLSSSEIYRLIQKDEIPYVRIKTNYRIPKDQLEAWIRERLSVPEK